MKGFTKLLPLLVVLGVAGCASTGQVDDAIAKAEAAQRDAAAASEAAAAAQRTADQALSAAQAAQASADEANEKIDRAFKKAMEK